MDAILLTDGYKLDHRRQYPEGTQFVYSNWTPRSCAYYPEAEEGVVVFGIQYFIREYLIEKIQKSFFEVPKTKAVSWFKRRIDTYVVHMVNPLGILNLSKTYDHVVFTASYKDWSKEMEIPANCTMAPL